MNIDKDKIVLGGSIGVPIIVFLFVLYLCLREKPKKQERLDYERYNSRDMFLRQSPK